MTAPIAHSCRTPGNWIRGWLVFVVAVCGCDSGKSVSKLADSTDQSAVDSTDSEGFNPVGSSITNSSAPIR